MTESEAIAIIKKNYPKCCKMVNGRYEGGFDDTDCELGQAFNIAIKALEEVQQYRAIGTMEELQTMKEHGGFTGVELANIAAMQMKLKEYEAIGTSEECRTAREKQIPKKPIMKQYFKDMEEKYLCCPTCGEILTDRIPGDNKTFYFHCMNCGQKFDWSDEE